MLARSSSLGRGHVPAKLRGRVHGGSGGDGELEAVSAFLFRGGTVDFEMIDPKRHSWMHANGYLRGAELFLRIQDEDNQITIGCQVIQCHDSCTFYVGEVIGYHQGLTFSDDTDCIDSAMLKYDADIRTGRSASMYPEWGLISTRIDCMYVISAMLRTVRLGWKVRFMKRSLDRTEHVLSVADSEELNTRLDALLA